MIEFTGGRERPVNWIVVCQNIADSYPDGIPHGVQKDFIQNALDARVSKEAIRVRFELVENARGIFFTMTDSKTTGLTGPVLTESEAYEEDLPDDHNWARFESFAFTKRDPDAIGARGQGKFIFLSASSDYTMLYDSLLDDGVYRLGATRATQTQCPIMPGTGHPKWEGVRAARELQQATGLPPLQEVGTRVIIANPTPELQEQLHDGTFSAAIQETWFRSLEKRQLEVVVVLSGIETAITLPEPFPLPIQDGPDHKVWHLGDDTTDDIISLATKEKYRVKHLHIVYFRSRKIPPELQGVTILHNGMKITSIPMNFAPPQVRERSIGYIEFDRELDRELRKGKNQNPNHYDLKWRSRLPKGIKAYITEQMVAFGKSKLGLGVDARESKRRRQESAEEWAFRQLQRFAKDLDLFGTKGGRSSRSGNGDFPTKPIGIRISSFRFPDPELAPRVDWGGAFHGLEVQCFNRTDTDRTLSVVCLVLHADSVVSTLIDHAPVDLPRHRSMAFDPLDIEITEREFAEPGEYRVKANLFDSKTGDRVDSVVRRFWVEKDPPLRKPFELRPTRGFAEPYERRQWLIQGEVNNSPTLYYSTTHPAYQQAEEEEAELGEYLLQVMLEGAVQFVLRRPDLDDGVPDFHPLSGEQIMGAHTRERAEIPNYTYDEVMRYLSAIRWRMFD